MSEFAKWNFTRRLPLRSRIGNRYNSHDLSSTLEGIEWQQNLLNDGITHA